MIIQDGLRRDGRRAGGRLLLPDADERELPASGDAGGAEDGHPARACTCCGRRLGARKGRACSCWARGTILREVLAAAELLDEDWRAADVWSVTSLHRAAARGLEVERWNMLHPVAKPRRPYVTQCLARRGPVVASTDYIRAFADQIQ